MSAINVFSHVKRPRVEMVPLIDTFFLLLAFFISSVLAMSVLGGLPIELPAAAHAAKLDPQELVVITLARDGALQLDGQPATLEDLSRRLAADPNRSLLRVAVRADRAVPTGELTTLLDAVRAAGVRRVGLVTQGPLIDPAIGPRPWPWAPSEVPARTGGRGVAPRGGTFDGATALPVGLHEDDHGA